MNPEQEFGQWPEGTDKFKNGYWPLYAQIIASGLSARSSVLEIGVFRGFSLRLWQILFPEGTIVGIDNEEDSKFGVIDFGSAHKIVGDQDSLASVLAADEICPDGYDLIIDDASHIAHKSAQTFKWFWPMVKPGGWYVLEDWAVGCSDSPHFGGHYGGDGMLRLAQEFVSLIGRQDHYGIRELRYRHGIAALRKEFDDTRD